MCNSMFKLRKWDIKDIDSVARYANNKKIAGNLRNAFPYPYTRESAESFISACIKSDSTEALFRAIDVNGEAVGSIGVFVKDDVYSKSAEMGYWLAEPFWGRGIMTQAIKQMCDIAFLQYDIIRIFAEPFAHNTASRKALENAGFKLEGVLEKSVFKNGEILDSCIYAIIKKC